MKQLTIKDIIGLKPCYAPTEYLPEDWTGTVIDILKMTDIPVDDRLWIAVRSQFLSDVTLKSFALACARQCEKYITDGTVKRCKDVTEAYLKGEATKKELDAVTFAAASATIHAAYAAASTHYADAACSAYAADAATYAAYSASYFGKRAAIAATYSFDAAACASSYAAYSASYSAYAARTARTAVREEQCALLIKLIEENEK